MAPSLAISVCTDICSCLFHFHSSCSRHPWRFGKRAMSLLLRHSQHISRMLDKRVYPILISVTPSGKMPLINTSIFCCRLFAPRRASGSPRQMQCGRCLRWCTAVPYLAWLHSLACATRQLALDIRHCVLPVLQRISLCRACYRQNHGKRFVKPIPRYFIMIILPMFGFTFLPGLSVKL